MLELLDNSHPDSVDFDIQLMTLTFSYCQPKETSDSRLQFNRGQTLVASWVTFPFDGPLDL